MKSSFLTAIAFATLLTEGALQAQDQASGAPPEIPKEIPEHAIFGLRSDAGDASVGPLLPQFLVRSSVEGESIKATIGTKLSEWENFADTSFAVSLTAPFNKKKKRGYFIAENGLPGTLNLEASFSKSLLRDPQQAVGDQQRQDFVAASIPIFFQCRQQSKEPDKECNGKDVHELVKAYGTPEQKSNINKLAREIEGRMMAQSYLGIQLAASVGHDTFAYRDPATLAEDEAKKTQFSLSGSLAYLPSLSTPVGFFGGGEYKKTYKLPDTEIRCPTAPAITPSIQCFNAAYGPPNKNVDHNIFGGMRFNGKLFKKIPLAADFRLTYDLKDDEWGASVPFYFLRDKDGKFNGGIRADYDGKKKDFTFGFFVGSNFDFLNP